MELFCPLEECRVFSGPPASAASLPWADTGSRAWLETALEVQPESLSLRVTQVSLCPVLLRGFILPANAAQSSVEGRLDLRLNFLEGCEILPPPCSFFCVIAQLAELPKANYFKCLKV